MIQNELAKARPTNVSNVLLVIIIIVVLFMQKATGSAITFKGHSMLLID